MKTTDLHIVIVNYNGKQWLEKLLDSLFGHYISLSTYVIQVTVVDNGSQDDSVEWLKKFGWLKVITSTENNGFAKGNNLALKTNKARYVLLLNSDTEIPPETGNLDRLIAYMDGQPTVAVVTPLLLLSSGEPDLSCHRGEPTPWASYCYFTGLESLFPRSKCFARYHMGWENLKTVHQIDACSGAAMLVRQSAIHETGLLDERFFMYAEDIDWCYRFREHGYSVVYNPGTTVVHHKYQSGIKGNQLKTRSQTQRWFYQTMLQYFDKHYPQPKYRLIRIMLRLFIHIRIRLLADK